MEASKLNPLPASAGWFFHIQLKFCNIQISEYIRQGELN